MDIFHQKLNLPAWPQQEARVSFNVDMQADQQRSVLRIHDCYTTVGLTFDVRAPLGYHNTRYKINQLRRALDQVEAWAVQHQETFDGPEKSDLP